MESDWLTLWNEIPAHVRVRLLIGSTGSTQLFHIAETALRSASECIELQKLDLAQILLNLTYTCMIDAWAESPANLGLASQVVNVCSRVVPLMGKTPTPFVQYLASIGGCYNPDVDKQYYSRTLQKNNIGKAAAYCSKQFTNTSNFFWLDKVHELALQDNRPDLLKAFLSDNVTSEFEPMFRLLQAEATYLAHEYSQAEALYKAMEEDSILVECIPAFLPRRAEMFYRQGDRERCMEMLRKAAQERPLSGHIIYRLYDMLTGADTAFATPAGSTAILLYTYNKADVLDKTLKSLHATDLPGSRVFVLDNASTDETDAVLRKYSTLFDDFNIVPLRVNIGAPAARNWLMSLPEVQECDYIAYLDDDVLLPEDWLGRLYAGFERYPDAGVVGARIADALSPDALQAAGFHLIAPLYPAPGNTPLDEPLFDLASVHSQSADSGQFRMMQPCTTVMGCCHLFKAETLNDVGHFDIQFNPTQFDDVDHDLRLSLLEKTPVYQGHVRVKHMSTLQGGRFVTSSKLGNSAANKYKLQIKYPVQKLSKLASFQYSVLENDFFEKLEYVAGASSVSL